MVRGNGPAALAVSAVSMLHPLFGAILPPRDCYTGGLIVAVKAIPRRLLIHSATHYYGDTIKDDWGNETHASNRQLLRVRFEPSNKVITTEAASRTNSEVRLSAVMFYDARNSNPTGITFEIGDEIQFSGKRYRVQLIDMLYDDSIFHHAELGLI